MSIQIQQDMKNGNSQSLMRLKAKHNQFTGYTNLCNSISKIVQDMIQMC